MFLQLCSLFIIYYIIRGPVLKTMPGHKVFLQDDGEIREGLTCFYCKLVLKDPVQTTETGLRLCKECFEEARK